MPKSLWKSADAKPLVGMEELVYRSNLLGTDRSVCNWGGGNTSMKTTVTDFRDRQIPVMWVKGSGCDLATMKAGNFTALRLDDVLPLIERDEMTDEEMVSYLTHCMIDSSHPRMSIETLLHAFLPFKHVDHTHPDAAIQICCADNGKEIAREIFGDRFVWVPYIRPGFKLSQMIAQGVKENPNAELVLMEKHGLVTWGDSAESCYKKTIDIISEAESFIQKKIESLGPNLFGGEKYQSLDSDKRKEVIQAILPTIRGAVSSQNKMLLQFDDGDDLLQFINAADAERLSNVGAACPDHLVHTKRTPLLINWDPQKEDTQSLKEKLATSIANYQNEYQTYFNNHKAEVDNMHDPSPRVILIPGIGVISTGKNKAAAEVSVALYRRAVSVMMGSTALGNFVSLDQKESFDIEYWPLELYKLSLAPPEAEFSRQVAFITGGAGGIGSSVAKRLVADGAVAVLADINIEGAQAVADEINNCFGAHRALAVGMDVTNEQSIKDAFQKTIEAYGGIDVVVNNAGLASSQPFEETSIDDWNKNMDVLSTGYFLVAREGFKVLKQQGIGGSMVFVGSKNSVYAGKNASAYSTAKAASVHLARCIAAEGGEHNIRVNSVLPDAVLQGSKIWDGNWRKERAESYNIEPEKLEEHYRKRTILEQNVTPDDIASAVAFLASSQAAKTTGCMLTVDAGVAAAFTR